MLVKLYYLLFFFIEEIVFLQYCMSVFEYTGSRLHKYVSLTGFYLLLFLISFLSQPLLNVVCFLLADFLFLFLIYQLKWYMAFFHAFFSTSVMCLSEMVVIAVTPQTVAFSFSDFSEFAIWIIPAILGKFFYFFGHESGWSFFSCQEQ